MGELVRFPPRLTAELKRERTVVEAFAAVERGDFDAAAVHEVILGRAGTWDEYVALCGRIKLVARVQRACGSEPARRCSCTARCLAWPHCAGGPEGL